MTEQEAADQAALAAAKANLRAAVELRRASRSVELRAAHDLARFRFVAAALEERMPTTVAAYLSGGTEPDTLRLVGWLTARGVRVLLPVLTDGAGQRRADPAWAPYAGPDALRQGPRGILEPNTPVLPAVQLPDAEVVVCPGLAANRHGDRLGRGGGWYDRALVHASSSTPVWVLLNADEVLPAIPTQPWDRRVDLVATPDGLIECEPPHVG